MMVQGNISYSGSEAIARRICGMVVEARRVWMEKPIEDIGDSSFTYDEMVKIVAFLISPSNHSN